MKQNNTLNVRRLVGAILLAIFAVGIIGYSQYLLGIAWVGRVRQFQQFLYFYGAWAIGLAIWYFVTLKKPANKKAELIVKIIFFIVIALNAIYGAMLDYSDAAVYGVGLIIFYAIGCPWGKLGYRKHPYQDANVSADAEQSEKVTRATSNKSWYRTWSTWVIIVLAILVISMGFFILTDGSFRNSSDSDANTSQTTKNDHTLSVDYKKYQIKAMKTYRVNYTDHSWDGGDVKINKVVIYQTAKPYKFSSSNDGKFTIHGFARIYMTVKADDDISIYPTQGTYSYSDGEQHGVDSMESWDGDINDGMTKSGTVTVPIQHLKTTSSLKSIRMKFDANAQDDDDDSLDKTFDLTVDLK